MQRSCTLLAGVLLALVFAGSASATTLVNGPAHPFSAQDFAKPEKWVKAASLRVRTVPGSIVLSHRFCSAKHAPLGLGDCVEISGGSSIAHYAEDLARNLGAVLPNRPDQFLEFWACVSGSSACAGQSSY
jgi:hypothetical protein